MNLRLQVRALAALAGAVVLTAVAADPPPQPRPCRELTGEERTKCEQQARESDASRQETPQPDTRSESDEHSDTADPPRA